MQHRRFIFLLLLLLISSLQLFASGETTRSSSTMAVMPTVKALFAFGDSLIDNGNNNFLQTTAQANYSPYGMDFPLGPTGRFTNGRTAVDILGQLLGIPRFLPVSQDPKVAGEAILHGVNYASAGAGIFESTNANLKIIPFGRQISRFQEVTLPDLRSQFNKSEEEEKDSLSSYLSQSIFVIVIGPNDYGLECLSSGPLICDTVQLTRTLMGNYTMHLQRLYHSGARRFVLFNGQPAGCSPFYRGLSLKGECFTPLNDAVVRFNAQLKASLERLTKQLPGFTFVYVNTYSIISNVIDNPGDFGIEVGNRSCCLDIDKVDGRRCVQGSRTCVDRGSHLYFDEGHLTEKVYNHLVTTAFLSESQADVYPFNIKELATLCGEQPYSYDELRETGVAPNQSSHATS